MSNITGRTCDECRFWNRNGKPFPEHRYGNEPWHQELESAGSKHRRCLRIIHGNGGSVDDVDRVEESAFVTDGSGFTAALRTLPTFGCALHEIGEPVKADDE